jgi:hypothetical protein
MSSRASSARRENLDSATKTKATAIRTTHLADDSVCSEMSSSLMTTFFFAGLALGAAFAAALGLGGGAARQKNCEASRLDEAIPRTVMIANIEELQEILDRKRNRPLYIMCNQYREPVIQKLKAASRARIH